MRSILRSGACAASILLGLCVSAQAADVIEEVPPPIGMEWYFSVFAGWSMPDEMDVTFETVAYVYNSINYTAVVPAELDLEDGFIAGIALGARLGERFRGEIELSGHRHENRSPAVPVFPRDVVGEVDAMFLLGNLWVDFPIAERLRPYVGGGAGVGKISSDLRFDYNGIGIAFISDSDWAFAYQFGGGLAFPMSPNAVLDIGYRYKAINTKLQVSEFIFMLPSKSDIDYRTHNILFGLRLGF